MTIKACKFAESIKTSVAVVLSFTIAFASLSAPSAWASQTFSDYSSDSDELESLVGSPPYSGLRQRTNSDSNSFSIATDDNEEADPQGKEDNLAGRGWLNPSANIFLRGLTRYLFNNSPQLSEAKLDLEPTPILSPNWLDNDNGRFSATMGAQTVSFDNNFLLYIFSLLSPFDVLKSSGVCRLWNGLADDWTLWEEYALDFGLPYGKTSDYKAAVVHYLKGREIEQARREAAEARERADHLLRAAEEAAQALKAGKISKPGLRAPTSLSFIASFEDLSPSQARRPQYLLQHMQSCGIDFNREEAFRRLVEEYSLRQRVAHNVHGPVLDLSLASLNEEENLSTLEALRESQGVRSLNLSGARLSPSAHLRLTTVLTVNRSLRSIDFTAVQWPPHALTVLAMALCDNETLEEIVMPDGIDDKELAAFYDAIASNRALRLIVWPKSVLKSLEKLARSNRAAMMHMGSLYLQGILQDKAPSLKARTLFAKAHDKGHPLAGYEIGKVFESEKNTAEAFAWYQKSAGLGSAAAQYKMVEYFRGVWPQERPLLDKPNHDQAFLWCKKSADQGFAEALYRLGRMYESGRGAASSLDKAGDYFYEAALRGHGEAFAALGALCNNENYAHHDPMTAQYYLEWGRMFTASSSSQWRTGRLLNSIKEGSGRSYVKS